MISNDRIGFEIGKNRYGKMCNAVDCKICSAVLDRDVSTDFGGSKIKFRSKTIDNVRHAEVKTGDGPWEPYCGK